jgi:hypothetical protein
VGDGVVHHELSFADVEMGRQALDIERLEEDASLARVATALATIGLAFET